MIKKEKPERVGTQGWKQFLTTKHEMLCQYDSAKTYAEDHPVKVLHGKVAEALFRGWLSTFLPKKYAVTSGYIVSQSQEFSELNTSHYDVIIYDQQNSPILWVEENKDNSDTGKANAIPAEYVKAVFEVKANLTEISSNKAMHKLNELAPLLSKGDELNKYKGKLPQEFFTGTVFFELREENEYKKAILNNLVPNVNLPYFGGIILKGNGRETKDTGLLRVTTSEDKSNSTVGKGKESLIFGSPIADSTKINTKNYLSAILTWSPANFSIFAFDLIKLLEGKYEPGRLPSMYGISWTNQS